MKKRETNFELNLIPFIDLLSTCICFLLITAVWIQVGSINVKQAVGGQPKDSASKPVVWVKMIPGGELALDVRDSNLPGRMTKLHIMGSMGKPNLTSLANVVEQLKTREPRLVTALLQPQAGTEYEDLVNVMDQFKKSGLSDLGVSPL